MKRNERVSVGTESSRVLKIDSAQLQLSLFPFSIVPLLAGNLARAAADALGGVN
jgi:hypothetical protein